MHRDAASKRPRAHPAPAATALALSIAVAALTLPSSTFAEPSFPPVAPSTGAGPGAIASSFGLTPPVRIGFCEEHPQDGTLGVTLVDRSGKEFSCGLEVGRTAALGGPGQPASWPRHVFVGATGPTLPAARLLPLWGTEERALIQLLTVAIADSISDAQNDLLLKGARSGILSDPGGFGLLRLIGSVERRRRMLAAISEGETAPVGDALAYFGLSGAPTVKRIELDRSNRLRSVTVVDAKGQELTASTRAPDGQAREDAWLVHLARLQGPLYIPLGAYEERYLLTVLATAIRSSEGPPSGLESRRGGESAPGDSALKAAIKTIQYRKQRIRERDRFS